MDEPLRREIDRLKEAILVYDRAMPPVDCPDRALFQKHRSADLATLADYQRAVVSPLTF
jgi:hypothetical protein